MNEKEKEEAKKIEAEKTADQNAPIDEKKPEEKKVDTPEVPEEEEKVTLSKKELEDLRKRAEDFNRSVELKRLKKLEDRGEFKKPENNQEVLEEINKLKEDISAFKTQAFNSNLSEAYSLFIKDNPWMDDDDKFEKIKENFNPVGTESKKELLSKFKVATQTVFPDEYEKHLEDKIKAKVLSNESINNSGGSANSVNTIHEDNKSKTKEDALKEKMALLYAKAKPGR